MVDPVAASRASLGSQLSAAICPILRRGPNGQARVAPRPVRRRSRPPFRSLTELSPRHKSAKNKAVVYVPYTPRAAIEVQIALIVESSLTVVAYGRQLSQTVRQQALLALLAIILSNYKHAASHGC
jgi:hypothetical protein